jgi:hypothetical protein
MVRNGARGHESGDGTSIWRGEGKAASTGDDEVHDRPGEGETTGLAREATDHLGPPANLFERALQ